METKNFSFTLWQEDNNGNPAFIISRNFEYENLDINKILEIIGEKLFAVLIAQEKVTAKKRFFNICKGKTINIIIKINGETIIDTTTLRETNEAILKKFNLSNFNDKNEFIEAVNAVIALLTC